MSNGSNQKVFILGVDGATFELIQPMIERGRMPAFARLMRESAWGRLRSSLPYVSPVAWATFMTGQNPAKHRILDFTYQRHGQRVPVNFTVLKSPTLWRRLSQAGKRVGVINVPVTYPPEPVNGFLVSGFPMPHHAPAYTYPPGLAEELEVRGWDLSDIAIQLPSPRARDEWIAGLYRRQQARLEATLHLMQSRPWDVFMVHMFETDRIQHEALNHWFRQNSESDRRSAAEIERFFQETDRAVDRIWRTLDEIAPGSAFIVMSDHGFGPTWKAVHPYNFLREAGLLYLQPGARVAIKRGLARLGLTPFNAFRFMPPALRRQLVNDSDVASVENKDGAKRGGPARSIARLLRRAAMSALLSMKDVDWSRTLAYCAGNTGLVQVWVNLRGRDPRGIVPPDDYQRVREEIIAALRDWRDPADGQPIVAHLYRREEIYSGPHLDEAADVLAVLRGESDYYSFNGPLFLSNRAIDQTFGRDQANHRLNGVVFIRDPRVPAGQRIDSGQIIDLAPTVLFMLGLPVPADMDGRVLEEFFAPEWLRAHQPEAGAAATIHESATPGFTADEEAAMLRQLKDLGYVD